MDPETVNGAGLHSGTARTDASPSRQSVITYTDIHGELARQDTVNVISGETPVTVDGIVVGRRTTTARNKKLKKVKGHVPNASVAAKVNCKLLEVDARQSENNISLVANGSGLVENHKWTVDFGNGIELDSHDYIQYFVRVCAYKANGDCLGCESRPVKK
jgi:hypothetical protein